MVPSSPKPLAQPTVDDLLVLKQQIEQCQYKDRRACERQWQRLKQNQQDISPKHYHALQARIGRSLGDIRARQALPLALNYDDTLPINQQRSVILSALKKHQVVVIAGETGSGKTTQLPKLCLALERGLQGMIGHTQPRRLAARAVAHRLADELQTPLGQGVGYKVRFQDQTDPTTRVKVMTDGVLLAEMQKDRYLTAYDTLIIDEAHERSLNIDFLLGLLKTLLAKRSELKLIITSATIDVQRFSQHFNQAPIIEVSGRTYPVEVHYRPLTENPPTGTDDAPLLVGIGAALQEIIAHERHNRCAPGDVLIFLSGERDIRDTAHYLQHQALPNTLILPLYARLSAGEQHKIFHTQPQRRIILSTNVAETSLTVPGIHYVIDGGTARISRYSVRSKVQRLPIEPISQASANQRKGRCGRIAQGICFRLYSEEDFLSRPAFTAPEVLRTNLASVILQMMQLGITDFHRFPFIDPPESKAINDGLKLLQEIKAIDAQNHITASGRKMAALPVDPRFACMLVQAAEKHALSEILIIVSALSIPDPREYPAEHQQAARQAHSEYQDAASDFMSVLNLWQQYRALHKSRTRKQLTQYCQKHFLSLSRLREWHALHKQLSLACQTLALPINTEPADYHAIHQSLLAGLLSHVGHLDEGKERAYCGTRNRRFFLFPASALFKSRPKWVLSAELVETAKLYARINARIDPEWIESAAAHLLKRAYSEPHWQQKKAQVVAYEQVTLYGLVIIARRSVHYGPIDPIVSREIFIQSALVEGQYRTQAAFFQHNQQLLDQVDQMEAKSRRRDILISPETLYQFYDERLPETCYNGSHFERWRKEKECTDPNALLLTQAMLMRRGASEVTQEQFPEHFQCPGLKLAVNYRFDPTAEDDGISLQVPVEIVHQLPEAYFDWLVPGMLAAKLIALMRTLPKGLRRNLVPIPDYAKAAAEGLTMSETPVHQALAQRLLRITGVMIADTDWNFDALEAHHRMNFQIRDNKNRLLQQGRDLTALKRKAPKPEPQQAPSHLVNAFQRSAITRWDFGLLPSSVQQQQLGLAFERYPTLIDQGHSVELTLQDDPAMASAHTRQALARLFLLSCGAAFKTQLSRLKHFTQSALYAQSFITQSALLDHIKRFIAQHCLFAHTNILPENAADFKQLCEHALIMLPKTIETTDALLWKILHQYHQIRKRLKKTPSLEWAISLRDIKQQLEALIHPTFLLWVDPNRLQQYPRYCQAIMMRLDKLGQNLARDRALTIELAHHGQVLQDYHKTHQPASLYAEPLQQYRWMLEEYRVSLFAQSLGVDVPVSEKKVQAFWQKISTS